MAATALREAAEEVGLDADAAGVRVVGTLDLFWIPVSDFAVTPVVAVAERRPLLTAAPAEVARIVEAPIATFLPDAPIEIVERTVRDWPLRYGAYAVDGLSVWGATARILSQLGAILADGLDPQGTGRRHRGVNAAARRRTSWRRSGTCGSAPATPPMWPGVVPPAPRREVAPCASHSCPWPSSPSWRPPAAALRLDATGPAGASPPAARAIHQPTAGTRPRPAADRPTAG